MHDDSKGSWLSRLLVTVRSIQALDIPRHAAYTGYFMVLSLFPALLLVLSCVRYTGLKVEDLIGVLDGFLPDALMGTAEKLVYDTYRSSTGAMAGISAVSALWSASKGIYGLLTGLNAIYGVSENRGYFYTRMVSVLYSVLFIAVALATLVLHVFGNTIIRMLYRIDNSLLTDFMDVIDMRFFFLLLLQSMLFTAMFMFLPNRRNGFWESLPGGLLSSIGWLVFSDLYSRYVTNFPSYANIYGSVYAIALSMLWLYFCLSILFYGGALNRALAAENEKKT